MIRPALPADSEFIVNGQLCMALETENLKLETVRITRGVNAVLKDPSKGFYLVALMDDIKCGSLLITPEWSDWRNAWVWWIQSVYVLPDFRKRGVYSALYTYVKHMVSERDDVSGIRLYVDQSNLRAQAVYSRLGMNGDHYRTFEWMK